MEKQQVWLKVPEAARHFGIPRNRMYDLIQKGQFPAAVKISERCIRVNVPEAERLLLADRRYDPS